MPNIHDGHRERTKQKFHDHGLDGFTDIEAIELLLMYAIPRRDTNVLAHALLDRFHSFRGVLEADVHDLEAVAGVGPNAAALIALVTALNRRYLAAGSAPQAVLNGTEAAAAYLIPKFAYLTEETVILVCTDAAFRVLGCHVLGQGGAAASVHLAGRDVVDIALREHAALVILAHNHPSGHGLPSNSDLLATRELARALHVIGVKLWDHLVVAGNDCVSMRDSEAYREYLY